MFWAICTNAQSSLVITLTMTTGGSHTIRLAAFDYNSTTGWQSTPFDVGSAGSGSAVTTGSATAVTPAAAGELAHSCIQFGSGAVSSITVTSPYVEQVAGGTTGSGWIADGRADSGDNQNCASGSQTCTYNWTTAQGFSSLLAILKPTAGGGGSSPPDEIFWQAPIFNSPEDTISIF
jgi:hypothetical protein